MTNRAAAMGPSANPFADRIPVGFVVASRSVTVKSDSNNKENHVVSSLISYRRRHVVTGRTSDEDDKAGRGHKQGRTQKGLAGAMALAPPKF